ncbi:DUF4231 domain-containing protein [Streptomyces sp. NPDC020965]|uniref:DUF4231 domain-containing protein n=1 Tax=Streptomyces sp. NPDC020965 TaxID=3365105 RepID=UPI0037B8D4D6
MTGLPGPRAGTVFRTSDLPALFHHTDVTAVAHQREAVGSSRRQLLLLVAGAAAAALPSAWEPSDTIHLSGALSALAYAGVLLYGYRASRRRAKSHWQLNRSAAEFIKSMCWRYCVHGAPFGIRADEPDGLFAERLEDGLRELAKVGWQDPRAAGTPGGRRTGSAVAVRGKAPATREPATAEADQGGRAAAGGRASLDAPGAGTGPDGAVHDGTGSGSAALRELITPGMRRLRAQPFGVRRETYIRDRLIEQRNWYHRSAENSRRATRFWSLSIGLLTLLALFFSLLHTFTLATAAQVPGLLSAAAAGSVAWSEIRRHQPLIAAHSLVEEDLAAMHTAMETSVTDAQWPSAVYETERIVSPQHTDWLVRHRS